MGIYIKGTGKPKNCHVCNFNASDCFCRITHGGIDRDDWTCDKPCPIVEIPEQCEDKFNALIEIFLDVQHKKNKKYLEE